MITAICQECDTQFDYELKPGFPRKYCPDCSAKKKQAYDDMQKPEVIKPGKPVEKIRMATINDVQPKVNGQLAMYVSYAKDIFCDLVQKDFTNLDKLMTTATDLVKQAQAELS